MSYFQEIADYEWSSSSPLSAMKKCGQCPWCAELQINGHDPDCAFMRPEIDLEKIKEDVRRAAWSATREVQSMGEIPYTNDPRDVDHDPICECGEPAWCCKCGDLD